MLKQWWNYLWTFALGFFYANTPKEVLGPKQTASQGKKVEDQQKQLQPHPAANAPSTSTTGNTPKLADNAPSKSDQMALVKAEAGVREEETEEVTETSVSEVTKDLGNTQMMEKSATFQGQQSTKVLEEHGSSTQNVEASAKVLQSVEQTVTENKKVTTSKVSTSQSYSFEESGEYEYEG